MSLIRYMKNGQAVVVSQSDPIPIALVGEGIQFPDEMQIRIDPATLPLTVVAPPTGLGKVQIDPATLPLTVVAPPTGLGKVQIDPATLPLTVAPASGTAWQVQVTNTTPIPIQATSQLPVEIQNDTLPVEIRNDASRFHRYALANWFNLPNTNEHTLPFPIEFPNRFVNWILDGVVENLPTNASLTVRVYGKRTLFGSVTTPRRAIFQTVWDGEPVRFEALHYDELEVAVQATSVNPTTRVAFLLIGSAIPYVEL